VRFHTRNAAKGVSIHTLAAVHKWVATAIRVGPACDRPAMQTIEWPFRAAEQLAAGQLTFRELRRFHFAIYPGVWAPRGVDLSTNDRARAAWLWSGRNGVVAGLTASAMLGAKWVDPETPVELIHSNGRPPQGIVVHRDELASGESQTISGLPVTTPARTAFDLGRRLGVEEGVQRIDALMNATDVKVDDIAAITDSHRGTRGATQLRKTLALADGGAESPQETRVRLLLAGAGLPKPETQIEFRDLHIRVDMGWRKWKVAVEYDGIHHWTDSRQRSWDIERIAMLEAAGWVVIRVSAEMWSRPQAIVERVRAALIARGCPKTW
jgi:very-short-patch-repair endonuclease